MKTPILVQRSYCIDVDPEWLTRQWRRDARVAAEDSVYGKLDALDGIIKIEYQPHFGPYVFLTLEVEYDTPETWEKIKGILD